MGAIWRQLLAIALGGACVFSTNCATAQQITPDRTLPNNSSVTINGSTFNITGGTQAGRNLFHSFQQFSVPTGGTASFINGLDIQNIISRVTGGSASSIDGLIKASGTANLFFLNPNGIVFGQHASLNVGGSFVATTANAIQFGNQGFFSASEPNNPALLTINPSALFYNQIAAGASIQNNSQATVNGNVVGLQVPNGKSLLLVGGNVNLDGGALTANGGRVELASFAAPGTVGLNVAGDSLSLSVPSGVQRSDVSLSNQAVVDVRSAGGGDIAVNARNLNVLSNSVLFAGIGTGLGNGSSTKAGDININADAISVDSGYIDNVVFSSTSKGNAGNINITTGSLLATNGAEINSFTRGIGNAGNVTIIARDAVTFDGVNSGSFSNVLAGSVGNGGKIDITAGSLSLTNGGGLSVGVNGASGTLAAGQGVGGTINVNVGDTLTVSGIISGILGIGAVGRGGDILVQAGNISIKDGGGISFGTFGKGDSGNISLTARDGISLDAGYIFNTVGGSDAQGNAGNINITTGSLFLNNGGSISSITSGKGNAANITIIARDAVTLHGVNGNGMGSTVFSTVDSGAIGNGGKIDITAGSFSLSDGGLITSGSFGKGNGGDIVITTTGSNSLTNGTLITSSTGQGNAGNIVITTTGSDSLTNSTLSTSSTGQGNAGNIVIQATENISLANKGIFSNVGSRQGQPAFGNVGNIELSARTVSLTDGAQLQAGLYSGGQGNPGIVSVKARDSISFTGTNSGIFSNVDPGGVGNGSDIQISAPSVSFTNGTVLNASNAGQGNAGNIMVQAIDSISLAQSLITSNIGSPQGQPAFGNVGNIELSARTVSLTDGAQLQAGFYSGGQGNPGVVSVKARDSISFAGSFAGKNSGIFTNVDPGGVGNGSDIQISAPSVYFTNGAALTASNLGRGNGGNIAISSGAFSLSNSFILTQTNFSGNGGNITLNLGDYLLLRKNSLISTNAGIKLAGGNGGNITINTPFIISIPNENSDITANAFSGSGGRVSINATNLFNIAPLSRQDLERLRPQDLDPRQLPTNDITAISQQNADLNGTLQIITPDIDPSRGLVTLPTVTEVAPRLISSNCAAFNETAGGSNFTITGRGGLPPSPDEPLTSDVVWSDTRLPTTTTQPHQRKTHAAKSKPKPIAIIPATGWVFNGKGEVTLISTATNATASNTPFSCPAR